MTIVDYTPRMGLPVHAHWEEFPWDAKRWPNFSPVEFRCRGTGRLALSEVALDRLQKMRTALGKPFYVNSGYRSPAYNSTLKGASRNSMHLDGIAFDISMRNHDPAEFIEAAVEAGFTGIGTYPGRRGNFVHVDDRGWVARWGDSF